MGGNSWAITAAWTFLCLALVLVFSAPAAFAEDDGLLQDLGLNVLPDVSKINISLDEYTNMMELYLNSRRDSAEAIPKLITFNVEKENSWEKEGMTFTTLRFPIVRSSSELEAQSAELRILAPSMPLGPTVVRVRVNQILSARRRRLVEEREIYLSNRHTKWCEFDVSSAVQSWFNGERNLGLELICLDCKSTLSPHRAAISALVHVEPTRFRRSYQQETNTKCTVGKRRMKCCKHEMVVEFKKLKIPGVATIVQPAKYDAGFCQGHCPPNYNHATNHSRIQSLMHQMNRKSGKPLTIPKACCAPSKLESIQILKVNPHDQSKLIVEVWDNMSVKQCACS